MLLKWVPDWRAALYAQKINFTEVTELTTINGFLPKIQLACLPLLCRDQRKSSERDTNAPDDKSFYKITVAPAVWLQKYKKTPHGISFVN